jgi:predicted DNA-binding transcriptional regulator YafY
MGIPVDGQAGRGGGYRLRAGARLPPLMLSDDEAAAVAYGLLLAERRGLAGASAAAGKVVRVLPERLARRVERLRDELTLSGEPDPVPTSPETLLLVAEAVRRHRGLRIGYVSAGGETSERTVEPLGLVARRARWYVPARDHRSGELRTFRADRIRSAALGGPAAPPEPGFDPDEHVVRMLAEVPAPWEVEVLVDAPLDELAPRLPPALAQLAAEADGTRLRLHAHSLDWAAGQLAALEAPFRVVRPEELRAALARLAARLAAGGEG